MPRYLVERTFPDGLGITPDDDGAARASRSSRTTPTQA